MESSPLTLAHSHARNALFETRKSNPVAASEEHDLAAVEFSTAAQGTVDPDALRTLELLEKHHKRLAEILRFQHEHPAEASPERANVLSVPSTTQPPKSDLPSLGRRETSAPFSYVENVNPPPRLPAQHRPVQRDTTSIASNLASARGIPSHPARGSPASPAVSTQNAGAKMAGAPVQMSHDGASLDSLDTELKARPSLASKQKPSWTPTGMSPADITGQQINPPAPSDALTSKLGFGFSTDEPFQRFYSTFEGLISKLSGPLTFASLPLGIDTSTQKSAADPQVDRNPASADIPSYLTNQPDVNRLVSKAALRAIRDKDGLNGLLGQPNPVESFYVVPTAGGTISYAGILSRAEKEARRHSLDSSRDDDFVDARENPPTPESLLPVAGDKGGKRAARSRASGATQPNTKTMEELQMENQALKHLSDTLSKRLHMWEVNAQSSSLALQQSLKAMQHQPTSSPGRQLSPTSSAVPHEPRLHGIQSSPAPAAGAAPVPTQERVVSGESLPSSSDANEARLKELEELLRRGEKELQRVGRENEKLRDVVGRYRDRWEKLKEGARVRREGNGNGNGGTNGAGKGTRTDMGKVVTATPSPEVADVAQVTSRAGDGGGIGSAEGKGGEQ
ncbi:uncharacterized protein PADG_02616 [Paracoccidioides brasiliensis Pb18]|uniref:Uncharacterized protein n=1 Tax=Paracoccidioides brasiliensis (strain Pb18) TaxID=502780 RepID=C1G611_PARBD|nr:uncharacterized protein PADG_02616 [Paracoccidioides brasiliensis Pb18]EEH46518.2 hypothetical protein PADG_02616 [Paracoccidioides brasiliensis Pb18]